MSEKSTIEITIEDDKVAISSDMSMIEVNFWLDHIKFLIASGEIPNSIG